MDYYGLVKIAENGQVLEELITSDDLKKGNKKKGVNGLFTYSDYIILTQVFKNDTWKGKQKLFSLKKREYFDIKLPREISNHKIGQILENNFYTYLNDGGLKEIALCNEIKTTANNVYS